MARGPKRGVRQRQKPAYDPDSGEPLRTTAYFPPEVAAKLALAVTSDSAKDEDESEPKPQVKPKPQMSLNLPAPLGEKVWKAADAADLSVSGLLTELVRRMPVDDDGRPVWPKQPTGPGELMLSIAGSGTPRSLTAHGLLKWLVDRMRVDKSYRPLWTTEPATPTQLALQMSTTSNAPAA